MSSVFNSIHSGGDNTLRGFGGFMKGSINPFAKGEEDPRYTAWLESQLNQQNMISGDITALGTKLGSAGDEMVGRARKFADDPTAAASEQALWNLNSRRMFESLSPRFTNAGIMTSGPGIDAMTQATQDLATQFADKSFDRNLQRETLMQEALKGYSLLMSLPVELRTKLLAAITAGKIDPGNASIMEQLGGGGGLGSILGNAGKMGA